MQRVKSMSALPSGFREFSPADVPDSIWSVLAECIEAARRVGAPFVSVEENYDGRKTKISMRVPQAGE